MGFVTSEVLLQCYICYMGFVTSEVLLRCYICYMGFVTSEVLLQFFHHLRDQRYVLYYGETYKKRM